MIVTKVLRKVQMAVTEVRSENPRPALTGAIPREDAFLVGLQLRDYPHHKLWEDGCRAPVCDLRAGESVFTI